MVTATKKNQLTGEWLQSLLEGLTDENNEPYFKKVLLGYDVNQIKTFGDGVTGFFAFLFFHLSVADEIL